MKSVQGNLNQWLIWVIAACTVYAAILLTVNFVSGDNTRIAYVNSAEILEKYTGAIEATRIFETEAKKWETNIRTLQAELDSLNFIFMQNKDKWNDQKKKEVAEQARKKDADLKRYAQATQQKAAQRKQELLAPVVADLNNFIADYARENNFKMVFGTLDGNIVYAEDAANITDDILTAINNR